MFKETIQNITSKTFGAVAKGAADFGGGLLDGAIEGITERSPLVGRNLAERVNTARITKQVAAKFVSDSSKGAFAEEVKKDVGENASTKEIKKKMASVLEQLTKDVKKQSADELKANGLYQKYSKFFDEYKDQVSEQLAAAKAAQSASTPASKESEPVGQSIDMTPVVGKLNNIEANTKELVGKFDEAANAEPPKPETDPVTLEKLGAIEANTKSLVDIADKPNTDKALIDKLDDISLHTGMMAQKMFSARATVGPVKPKETDLSDLPQIVPSMVGGTDVPESKVEPTKSDSNFADTLASFSESEMKQVSVEEEILSEIKVTNFLLEEAAKSARAADAAADENASESKVTPAKQESNNPIQEKNPNVEKNKEKGPSLVQRLLEKGKSGIEIPKMPGGGAGGSMAASAAKFAGGAALVAGAGYAGYKAGEWLNENTNIQSNIASGIDTAKGWFGNSDADVQKNAENKSVQDLYAKRVKDGTLTPKAAEFFKSKGVEVDKSKIKEMPTPVKNNAVAATESAVEKKDTIEAEKQSKSEAPVVLNTTNNNVPGGGSSAPTIISGMNVRNTETTFDRVQMQNYWSRTA
jgi:hypothetical protein